MESFAESRKRSVLRNALHILNSSQEMLQAAKARGNAFAREQWRQVRFRFRIGFGFGFGFGLGFFWWQAARRRLHTLQNGLEQREQDQGV
jgi:hypothetical protein